MRPTGCARARGLIVPLVAVIGSIVVMVGAVGVQSEGLKTQLSGTLPHPYRVIDDFFKLPGGRSLGSAPGVDIDRDGRSIWVVERCGGVSRGTPCAGSDLAPILKFDASGHLAKSFGSGLFVNPHGLHVDWQGNIWVTDGAGEEGRGHQVFKFSPDGMVLMRLGRAGVAGDGPDTFNQPSDVFVAPGGEIFVADGHGGSSNARIVKFSKAGAFVTAWGRKGSGPGEFDTPHSLAMDSRGRLFVADRGNSRIQIFDQAGAFLAQWRQFGRPSGLYIDRHDTLYAADTQSDEPTNPGYERGIRIGSAKDGTVTALIPDPDPDGTGEGVAADSSGNVYGALTAKRALKKYMKT
jgi:sugar lactone lactonase YvrE